MSLLKTILTGALLGKKRIEKLEVGRPGDPTQLIVYKGKIYIYNSQGQTLIDGGYISARAIKAEAIITSKLSIGGKKFSHNLVFSAVDENTTSWTSGTINFSDGTYVNISLGNTGNLTEKNYLYFNNTSTLQKTTDYSSTVSNQNIILAIVEPVSSGKCLISSFLSGDSTIDGANITTGKIESSDGSTYFDLNNGTIMIDDGIPRIVIGNT